MSEWKHIFQEIHSKGRTKVVCIPCAISSPWFKPDELDRIALWTTKHGVRERKIHDAHPSTI